MDQVKKSLNEAFTGHIFGIITIVIGLDVIINYIVKLVALPGIKHRYENEYLDNQPMPGWHSPSKFTDMFVEPWHDFKATLVADKYQFAMPRLPIPAHGAIMV